LSLNRTVPMPYNKPCFIVIALVAALCSPTWSASKELSPLLDDEFSLLQTLLTKGKQTENKGQQHAENIGLLVHQEVSPYLSNSSSSPSALLPHDPSLPPSHARPIVLTAATGERDCSNLWEQQATNKPRDFTHFDHGSNYEGLYVDPNANIAFCLIEKNACSQWTSVFTKLEQRNLDFNQPNFGLRQQTYTDQRAMETFQNPNATRGVFVRDPLERFLSGFLDKCLGDGCSNPYCFMREKSQDGTQITFSQAVSWLLRQDEQHNLAALDGHFKPQAWHCELEKRINEYNVIGLMQSGSLADTASCFLERAGLDKINAVSSESDSEPFWQPPGADAKSTSDYLKRFYTPESAKAVYDVFSMDYKTFNLSRPEWIESATGEFYESISGTMCDQGIVALQHEETATDIWDIATLAKRAGFVI